MGTDLANIQNQLPAELREQLAAQVAADIARLGAIGGKDTIRVTQDKKFELPTGDILDELEVVVLDFVYRNDFYLGAYNKKDIKPPACFAINPVYELLSPSDKAPMKQTDGPCNKCQQDQWGTSPQGDGKACKNTVLMAVMPTNAGAGTPIWTLKTSPTAMKYFNAHVAAVNREANAPVGAVVTRIYFDPAQTYASLRFEILGVNPVFAETYPRQAEARDRIMQPPDTTGFEMPVAKGAGKKDK